MKKFFILSTIMVAANQNVFAQQISAGGVEEMMRSMKPSTETPVP